MNSIIRMYCFIIIMSVIGLISCENHLKMDVNKYDCLKAVQVAVKHLENGSIQLDDYKIIEVKNNLFNSKGERTIQKWILTLKKRDLLENENGIIGKGGEIFIEVDLSNSECKIVGYGE